MISLISVCYDRAEQLDKCLPLWLAQSGVDLEIVLAVGPDIKRIDNPKVKYVDCPTWGDGKLCESFNRAFAASSGDLVFITYSDMAMPDKRHLAKMCAVYEPGRMVSNQIVWEDGSLGQGIWLHGMLTSRELIAKAGGWDTFYDGGYAYEDSGMVHRLLNAGGQFYIMVPKSPGFALTHISHGRPPASLELTARYARNKMHYHKTNPKESIMEMYNRGAFEIHEYKEENTSNNERPNGATHRRGRPRNKQGVRKVVEDTADKKDIPRQGCESGD